MAMDKVVHFLHLEDSMDDVLIVRAALDRAGIAHKITRVQTEGEFDRALRQGGYDVILGDFGLPGYDGLAALKLARERCPDVPFIFVSGTMGEDAAIDALTQGATDYVFKHKLTRLAPAVQRALHEAENRRERQRSQQELERSRQQMRQLALHLQSVREAERTAIAREIHDELGQLLTGLKFDLTRLKITLAESRTRPKRRASDAAIADMVQLVDMSLACVRRIATELRPPALDELGLVAALEWQVREFTDRTGICCVIQVPSPVSDLSPELSTALFRIFQEALTNIARHAHATNVEVTLTEDGGVLRLVVRDNGAGITASQLAGSRSLGILGMRERALLFGGSLQIDGIPGQGTTVVAEIPRKRPQGSGDAQEASL